MRLLLVGTSPAGRGTELHLVSLARALAGLGHQVHTVAHPGGHIARLLRAEGLATSPAVFRNSLDPRAAAAVLRAIREVRPDWIVGNFGREYWPLVTLGRLTGTRVALFRHVPGRLKWTTRVFVPRLAQRFVTVSEFMRGYLTAQGVPADRLQVLYNPIELDRFQPDPRLRADTRAGLGVAEDEVLVGFVGSIDADKGAFHFAEAFNQAMRIEPRLRGLWVGQEAAHPQLLEVLDPALRARHILRGWTADLRPLYVAMDGLAVPSEWQDPCPRVPVEAQACGVPVLGSRIGGVPETLQEGTSGFLLAAGDVAAWRDALVEFARWPRARREEMGRAGVAFVASRFDAASIARQFSALLAEPSG
jgi:glycosyltransferase involved in cell wall biosynthesis